MLKIPVNNEAKCIFTIPITLMWQCCSLVSWCKRENTLFWHGSGTKLQQTELRA